MISLANKISMNIMLFVMQEEGFAKPITCRRRDLPN